MVNREEEDAIEEEVAFNDALKTLGRVGEALNDIRNIDYLYPPESIEKQKAFINLVRRFYIVSVPLMKVTQSEKYKNEILNLTLKKVSMVKGTNSKYKPIYDPDIDKRLNEILIEIQQQIKKYLMPSRREDDGL